jgi:hypothetical protein
VIELRGYVHENGNKPLADWLEELDAAAAAKVNGALTTMERKLFEHQGRRRGRI